MQGSLIEEILWSFAHHRDPIPDSDLDDDQPVTLTVTFRLGDIRRARHLVGVPDSVRQAISDLEKVVTEFNAAGKPAGYYGRVHVERALDALRLSLK